MEKKVLSEDLLTSLQLGWGESKVRMSEAK
jgi:hypothetical protein